MQNLSKILTFVTRQNIKVRSKTTIVIKIAIRNYLDVSYFMSSYGPARGEKWKICKNRKMHKTAREKRSDFFEGTVLIRRSFYVLI